MRRRVPLARAAALVACVAFGALGAAHVRLRYEQNGSPLFWSDPDGVDVTIQSNGSDDIGDGSHATAIQAAVEAWNAVEGSRARLALTGAGAERIDWQSPEVHLVLFDETGASGFFPGYSSIVAITPLTFFTDGRIVDADVIFNGKNFRFTTSGESGRFDVEDVAAHELGHLLGLDHSGVAGATMYPYVDAGVILHRSLSMDDARGLRHVYPSTSFARISGQVRRSADASPIAGAHVWALDADGRVAAAILSSASGAFTLQGLDAGTYSVHVDPLDGPVSAGNVGGGQTIATDFEATALGSVTVGAGALETVGTHEVGPDVAVQLGRTADRYPLRAVRGETSLQNVRGNGLVAGSTITCSDPSLGIHGVVWSGASVTFQFTVPAGAPLGHVDLVVTDPGGARDVLVGGVEITPPDPVVAGVTPGDGDPLGATPVAITGTGFRPGARVVIGDRVYRDGAAGGCVVEGPGRITLTTAATIAGDHDVVVIDPTGVEGRLDDSFEVVVQPDLTTVFPTVGAAAGGTLVVLTGRHFVPGSAVEIDGVPQADVTVRSPSRIDVVTSGGVPGGPHVLSVTTPGGLTADAAFTYLPTPDPAIHMVTPDSVDSAGGSTVTVFGGGFDGDTEVVFGADPRTGAGGAFGAVDVLDAGTLRVTTPGAAIGTTSLMVRDGLSGQVATMEAAFTFTGEIDYGDDGGGGCGAVLPRRPPTARDIAGGAGWIALAFVLGLLRSRRAGGRASNGAAPAGMIAA